MKLFLYFRLSTIGLLLFTFFALFVELLQLGVCEDLSQTKQILQMEMKVITTLSLHNLLGKQKIQSFWNMNFAINDEIAKNNGGNLRRAMQKWRKWKLSWKYKSNFPFLGECMVRWLIYGIIFKFLQGTFCLSGCGDKCMFQFLNLLVSILAHFFKIKNI